MVRFYNIEFRSFIPKLFCRRNFSNLYNSVVFKYAIKIYNDPLNQRNLIRNDNKNKIGIYSWVNNINGKFYIGSGDPLYLRISDYFQNWYFLYHPNLYIVRALSKYGMKNFSLVILEYSDSENLILCEQKWIDLLKPEYNISLVARNIKGCKRTKCIVEIDKIGKKQIKSNSYKGENKSFCDKKHSEKSLTRIKTIKIKKK